MFEKVRVAIFDLDGTLLNGNIWRVFMKYFRQKGMRRTRLILFLTYHLTPLPLFKLGLFSKERYFSMWAKNLSWLLKGLTTDQLDGIFNEMNELFVVPNLREGLLKRLEFHKAEGMTTVLESGTFSSLLEKIGKKTGFDFSIGTDLEVRGEILTGRIKGKFNSGEEKVRRVEELFKNLGKSIDWSESFAYADSIFDLPLLERVGHPVCVYPDPDLKKHAQKKGWEIYEEDSGG